MQYFDNRVCEGQTHVGSSGDGRKSDRYSGPLTRWAVHRRQKLAADNSGGVSIGGDIRDVVVEDCALKNPVSAVKVDGAARGVLLRNNTFEGTPSPRYGGDGLKDAVVLPAVPPAGMGP